MQRRSFLSALPLGLAVLSPAAPPSGGRARLRTAICAYSFRGALGKKQMTYDDLVHMAVENNVDGLDLTVYWFPGTGDDFLLPLKRLAYRNGVEIYSISVRTEMTRATGQERAKEVSDLHDWIDVAQKLGAGHIRVFGGKVPKGATEDQAAGWAAEVLKQGADYAARKGVILGLENHGGITEKAERILEIVKRVDSPWVGVNLDTGNFRANVMPQIEMCLPYAVNVQVKAEIRDDSGQRVPQDWDKVIGAVARSGYKGYLALEYEAREDPKTAVPSLLERLNRVARKYSA